jgi:hypothetical protein
MLKRLLLAGLLLFAACVPARAAVDFGDIICETTATTGTGTINLAGAVSNYATFVSQITSGASVPYHIVSGDDKLETGIGVFTDGAPDTLTRVADWSTDGSGAELTLTGTSTVCVGPIASLYDGAKGFQLYTADAGAVGGVLPFWHDSATPADGDIAADIQVFAGADDERVGRIALEVDDGATTTEDTQWQFVLRSAGSDLTALTLGGTGTNGLYGHILDLGTVNFSGFSITNTSTGAGGPELWLYGNSSSPTTGDTPGALIFAGEDSAGNTQQYGYMTSRISDATSGSEDSNYEFQIYSAGSTLTALTLGAAPAAGGWAINASNHLLPGTDAASDIGTSTVGINDLHFGSGGIINFDGGDVTMTHSANKLSVDGGDVHVLDGFGVVIGHTAQVTIADEVGNAVVPEFQIIGTGGEDSALTYIRYGGQFAPHLMMAGNQNATPGSHTIAGSADYSGVISGANSDGTDFEPTAAIIMRVDGTPGADDMPGRIEFYTTADNTASTTIRFTLASDGCLYSHNATNTNAGNCADGQINADAVYDDDVALTSMPLSDTFRQTGQFSVEEWEQKNNRNRKIPARTEKRGDEMVAIPEKDDSEPHRAARYFDSMLKQGFDPRDPVQWIARMRIDKVLPGMPTEQEWNERAGQISLGEMTSRIWLTIDMLGLTIETQQGQIDALTARIEALEGQMNGNPNNRP